SRTGRPRRYAAGSACTRSTRLRAKAKVRAPLLAAQVPLRLGSGSISSPTDRDLGHGRVSMAKNKNPDDLPTVTITDEMKSGIYALKTTINQEKAVGDTLAYKAKKHKVGVVAVLSPPELRGYVLIEAFDRDALEKLIKGVPHARGLVAGETALSEVEHFLTPKPVVAGV